MSKAGRTVRLAIQVIGFAIGLGLFWWCAHIALRPENRHQLERLGQATLGQTLTLAGLSAATIILNGLIFWLALRPVRRLPIGGVVATSSIASLLNYLPFKLGMMTRIAIHNRRDRVPLLTIGAWFGAVGVSMFSVFGPTFLAGLWRGRVDAWWWIGSVGGIALAAGAVLITSRLCLKPAVWTTVERMARRLPAPRRVHALREQLLLRAHEGVRMLADPIAFLGCCALRIADVGVHASRFMLAAAIVGGVGAAAGSATSDGLIGALRWDQAILAGSVYFLIGSLAPTGQLGVREAGTAGLLASVLKDDFDKVAVVALLVSAMEMAVVLVCAVIGLAFLRPDRLLSRSVAPPSSARRAQQP